MKLRAAMILIGLLAVTTWLAVPAVRIWRDPSTRLHYHRLIKRLLAEPDRFSVGPFVLWCS